jgi:hypothetical protein
MEDAYKLTNQGLRLLCGASSYPPNVLQPTTAYCTNQAFSSPSNSKGAPHQMT